MKPNPVALVVDRDKASRRWLRQLLEGQGYRTLEAEDGAGAVVAAELCRPDVVILEWSLPGLSGRAVLEQLRRIVPCQVLVLSACEAQEEIVEALDAGARDYLVKPFLESELLARLRVLQRCLPGECYVPRLQRGPVHVDLNFHQAGIDGCEVSLTPIEAALLHTLLFYEGQVVGRRHLLRSVWGAEAETRGHYLRVFISALRRKLAFNHDSICIETVESYGYRVRIGFAADVHAC